MWRSRWSPMARALGYEVTIVDPRSAFATDERFGKVAILREWPDEALPKIGLDGRTALIALTHDPKIDDPALIAALSSDAFYVGALGSRKTHAKRVERLLQAGVSPGDVERIHAPDRPRHRRAGRRRDRRSRSSPRSSPCNAAKAEASDVSAKIAAIVLAAGRSSRMAPRNKLLETGRGQTDRRRAAEAALASGAAPVIVVTGFDAARIAAALAWPESDHRQQSRLRRRA